MFSKVRRKELAVTLSMAVGVVIVLNGLFIVWGAYHPFICALEKTPTWFIFDIRDEIKNGHRPSEDEVRKQWASDVLAHMYTMKFEGPPEQSVITFTPISYSKGLFVTGSRFAYRFDTKNLKTQVYDKNGVCFYTTEPPP